MFWQSSAAIGLMLLFCISGCGAGADAGERPVAKVGTSAISARMLRHWAGIELGAAGDQGLGGPRARVALRLLLLADRTLGEAAEAGVSVGDARAQAELATYKSFQSQEVPFERVAKGLPFIALLDHPGETHADRVFLMKLDLLAFDLEQKRLREAEAHITHAELARYYAANKGRFVIPEQRDLQLLGNKDLSLVRNAKSEIQAGANFISVAKRMSTDPEAPEGVQLDLQHGQEEPEFEAHVFSARPGVLVGPIKQVFYYLFRVTQVRAAHQLSLEHSEPTIRRLLVASRKGALVAKWLHDAELAWTAKTECRSAYAVQGCKRYGA
jgi:hypothetical protein